MFVIAFFFDLMLFFLLKAVIFTFKIWTFCHLFSSKIGLKLYFEYFNQVTYRKNVSILMQMKSLYCADFITFLCTFGDLSVPATLKILVSKYE